MRLLLVNKYKWSAIILLVSILTNSCKKLVDVDPPVTRVSESSVYESDATAIAVLSGVYAQMSGAGYNTNFTGGTSISLITGLSADELELYRDVTDVSLTSYYSNSLFGGNLSQPSTIGANHWSPLYSLIFTTNAAIEGLMKSKSLRPAVKQQLLGEAKFLRAFFYFYLVNLYGDVPLVVNTDYTVMSTLSRTSKEKVYQQVIEDLKEAQTSLSENYLDGTLLKPTTERTRPTRWAATAMLARVYLYLQDWANAENQATTVINNLGLYKLTDINDVFLKNSYEAIWQLQPVITEGVTEDANVFILNTPPTPGPSSTAHPAFISPNLIASFESNDQRKVSGNWIDTIVVDGVLYNYPFKYKNIGFSENEYLMVLRLAELYLIRSEARAHIGNFSGSASDLNTIRKRAGLGDAVNSSTEAALLKLILQERKVELFTEWGHRWFDLKRTKTIDSEMSIKTPLKGGTWETTDQLYPILYDDIVKDPNLNQNPGY